LPRETLIKSPLSTGSIDVKPCEHELVERAEDTGDDDGIRAIYEENATGDISGRDGAGGAVGEVVRLIEPHYPKPGNGRRLKELEKMLRIHFLQQWFNLSDPGVEAALYDSAILRQFTGIDLGIFLDRLFVLSETNVPT
jgi:hypothetical protein